MLILANFVDTENDKELLCIGSLISFSLKLKWCAWFPNYEAGKCVAPFEGFSVNHLKNINTTVVVSIKESIHSCSLYLL